MPKRTINKVYPFSVRGEYLGQQLPEQVCQITGRPICISRTTYKKPPKRLLDKFVAGTPIFFLTSEGLVPQTLEEIENSTWKTAKALSKQVDFIPESADSLPNEIDALRAHDEEIQLRLRELDVVAIRALTDLALNGDPSWLKKVEFQKNQLRRLRKKIAERANALLKSRK